MAASTNGDHARILDINVYPTAQKLNARCAEFFTEVQDLWVITWLFSSRDRYSSVKQDTRERFGTAPEHRLRSW